MLKMDLNSLCGGEFQGKLLMELEKVIQNINDPNTDAKKKRKLAVTFTFTPNKTRDAAQLDITWKPTLVSAEESSTTIMIGREGNQIIASEINNQIPGQTFISIPEEEKIIDGMRVDVNTGEIKEEPSNGLKVVGGDI